MFMGPGKSIEMSNLGGWLYDLNNILQNPYLLSINKPVIKVAGTKVGASKLEDLGKGIKYLRIIINLILIKNTRSDIYDWASNQSCWSNWCNNINSL